MVDWFVGLSPVMQALLGTCFTWFVTALGAALVFFFKKIDRKVMDGMLGSAAGVMIAASFWSLLAPAIAMVEKSGGIAWLPPLVGFLSGGAFLWGIDRLLPHLHRGFPTKDAEGIKTSWQRSILLVLAITLHNIPEGLAVGVAFGAAAAGYPSDHRCGHCPGNRYRSPEFSGRCRGFRTAAAGRLVTFQEFHVWTVFRYG